MSKYFEQNIINILKVENLDDEQKLALIEQISELVEKRVLVKILDSLDEGKRNEFMDLLDGQDQAKTDEFISVNVPEFFEMLAEETDAVKQELGEEMESRT
jgi:hypothetical protein